MARHKLDDGVAKVTPEFDNKRKQRRYNRLSAKNGDKVWGIAHGTDDIEVNTTPVDELFPGQQVGAAAVKERSARQLDESIRKSLDDYKEYDDRYNSVIGDLESAGKLGKYDAVQAKKGELPYQTWERATGLKWSEAKKRGYTTGRDQENLQLQRDLLAGNVSKQGGYSDERPEGYKNSKLGQGSYYLTKPKQTAPAATQSKTGAASASKPAVSTSVSKQVESNNAKTYSNVGTETNKSSDIINDVNNNSALTYNNDISSIGRYLASPRTPRIYNPRDYTTWGLKPRILKTKEEKNIEDKIKRNFKAHYLYGIPVQKPEDVKDYPPKKYL